MQAEVISIGSELLAGDVVDTNAATIARQFGTIGIPVCYQSAVGDHRERIQEILSLALRRSGVVITTGGIGPTEDDLTREIVARALGVDLEFHPELLAKIEERFQRLGVSMTPNNRKQAYIPAGSIPIENPRGTAPGFIAEHGGNVLISLPGVPAEMVFLLEQVVLPFLQSRFGLRGLTLTRTLKVAGLGESRVDQIVGDLMTGSTNPAVGLLAREGETHIRVTARGEEARSVEGLVAGTCREILQRLGNRVFGQDEETLEAVVGGILLAKGLRLAVAEWGSGGFLLSRLAAVPGSVGFLQGGVVRPHLTSADSSEEKKPEMEGACLALMADFQASGVLGLAVTENKCGPGSHAPWRAHFLFLGPWGKFQRTAPLPEPPALWRRASTSALEILRRILLVGSPDLS
ncbi:MAG: CinA family nicotinamide mononucleotide deamidase-related protein [Candidatus Tectomicrobia bacterium]|uniref:CinA-like protein n=1 Tax=Tectimicrobiota bacterium TaxID=2528274 RepID=A0A932M0G9_UNCTE|nr:CinA family nicotinamide mononucleotide deamidase-related protein [Candidatus Tectomicrobia bacterium]